MSTLETTLRIFPRLHAPRSWRLVERNIASSRGAWLVFVSGFFEPLFYLFAMGVGVGALVGTVDVNGQAVGYREFVGPALLAASAMNGAVYESGNVFFKLKYAKTYDGVLATPLGAGDVALGEIGWAVIRASLYALGFMVVLVVLGLLESPWAVAAVPAATLLAFAFAAVGMAATTFMRSWQDFDLIQLFVLPMFLFSGTFYPISSYPPALQLFVSLTPLYQGVALCRALITGAVDPSILIHVAYLAVMGLIGLAIVSRRLDKLLLK
jgi:lipooligosaccharide transport system permease protein